ncbi:MAG: hypothetical protein E7I42_02695 [Pluralibacter gergoviae]|nr:hypothetical protein [Pluralibacter gergoviae]
MRKPGIRIEEPLPDGSHRYLVWRLSTPCAIALTRYHKNFACLLIHHTLNTALSSWNVFAKAQGIVKAKHRFLVQDAEYS